MRDKPQPATTSPVPRASHTDPDIAEIQRQYVANRQKGDKEDGAEKGRLCRLLEAKMGEQAARDWFFTYAVSK